jgi:hypothetical protein
MQSILSEAASVTTNGTSTHDFHIRQGNYLSIFKSLMMYFLSLREEEN